MVTFAGTAGCGASTMMTAMAEGIAAAGRTATLVDLDPLAGKLATRLGVEPQGDLAELLVSIDPADPEGTDESTAPGEEHDFDPPIASDLVEGVIALAGAHISLVAYPRAGPPPTTPPARVVCMLLGQLANRTHVVMVSGMSDPEVRTTIMRHADARVLVFEPTLSSISSAVHCLALLGTEYSTLLVQCHPRTGRSSPLPVPDPLCARRATPRCRRSVRCLAPRRRYRPYARPFSRQGVPQGPGRGGRARARRLGPGRSLLIAERCLPRWDHWRHERRRPLALFDQVADAPHAVRRMRRSGS